LLQTVCNECFVFQLLSSQTTPSEISEIDSAEAEEVKLETFCVFVFIKVVQNFFKACISNNNAENCFWWKSRSIYSRCDFVFYTDDITKSNIHRNKYESKGPSLTKISCKSCGFALCEAVFQTKHVAAFKAKRIASLKILDWLRYCREN